MGRLRSPRLNSCAALVIHERTWEPTVCSVQLGQPKSQGEG